MIGSNIFITNTFNFSRGRGFDVDYQAVLDRATVLGYTLPSDSQQIKQNNLVLALKAAGIWNKLDTFAVFANDGGSNFGLIDWKRLVSYTAVNSPTFTTNQGFTGNGTSSYINTNFNPLIQGLNYTQNNASRYIYTFTLTGVMDGIESSLENRITLSGTSQRINQGTGAINTTYIFDTGASIKSIHRTSLTNVELFSGTIQSSRTSNSVSIVNANQLVSRSGTSYSTNRVGMYAMGASLISENTAFVNAFNTYLTSL